MKNSLKLLLVTSAFVVTSSLALSYTLTIKNHSDYTIGVLNGATSYDNTVGKGSTKSFNLTDGNNFQIYYNHPWGSTFIKDYLGGITRDGNSGYISVTLQQPGQIDTTWHIDNLIIGNKNYGSTELKHWPKAPSLPGCNNQSWGSICSYSASSTTMTYTN
ncbi:hypothetical protein L3V83_08880 [Thiotrichales bacterium 19X7-9]|nr:hypothetical protein [Thiotrichales bacterium 19X7-9]